MHFVFFLGGFWQFLDLQQEGQFSKIWYAHFQYLVTIIITYKIGLIFPKLFLTEYLYISSP